MPTYIHARKREKGFVFRIWSTIVNAYYCEPLSEEKLRDFLALQCVERALNSFEGEIDERIKRAVADGTSECNRHPDPADRIDGPWYKQLRHEPSPPDLHKEWQEKRRRQKKLLEKILANWSED